MWHLAGLISRYPLRRDLEQTLLWAGFKMFLLTLLYVMSAPWLYPGFAQFLCCTQMCQLQSTVLSCCEGSMLDNGGLVMSVFFL